MKPHRVVLPLAAAWLLSHPALATSAADQAAAEALFTEAKKLVAAGDFEHACPKFAESNRLDPGSGTLLNLGACYEKVGKLASAWGAFNEAAVTARNAGDSGRQEEAARRAAALAPRVPKLTIVVSPMAHVAGFELRRDDEVVGEGQWGSPIPTDPGQHNIQATAPGYKPWSAVVRVETAAPATSVEIPPLEKLPTDATPGAHGFVWTTQRTAGVAMGAVGVAGLAIGGILGGVTLSKTSALRSGGHCNADLTGCDATGLSLRQDAKTMATASTAGLVAGAAALGVGVVVFATGSPRSPAASGSGARVILGPIAGADMTGVLVRGGW
jgi:hypothetical protein